MSLTVQRCIDVMKQPVTTLDLRRFYYQQFADPKNFEAFCRFILPGAFTKPFSRFHREIIEEFMKDKDSAVAAPRGHGKSTLIGQGFVIWNILYKRKKYIVYTSQNHTKSVQFLDPVREELKTNDRIRFIYGDVTLRVEKDDKGKDREDVFDINGVRIQALSFEKNIRGLKHGNQRPDLVICDDIEDDDRVLNPELRVKDAFKLDKQIIPALDAETGVLKFVGTILHLDSLLTKKLITFSGQTYRACELDSEGRVIPETILFPDLFTADKLNDIKRKIGSSAFQSEYLNDPVDNEASLIKREWIVRCFDDSLSFDDGIPEHAILGADFAYSDRVSADKSAFVAVSKGDMHTIHFCDTKKAMSISEQFNYLQYLHVTHKFSNLALEENSIRSMSKDLKGYNFPFTLFWTGNSDKPNTKTPDEYFQGKRHTVSKINMIKRLAVQFENRNIRIPYRTDEDKRIAHTILDECSSFALQDGKLVEVGVHPDIPIALAFAIEYKALNTFVLDW